jgi:hypothetical protein
MTLADPNVYAFQLRPDRVAEKELDWFFNCAESAMGLRSNFWPLRMMALTGVVGTVADPADIDMEDRVEAAHAERIIRERLRRMPERAAGILYAAYEPKRWPSTLYDKLGWLTGIVVRLAMGQASVASDVENRAQYEHTTAGWLNQLVEREGELSIQPLRNQAQSIYAMALRTYMRVRGPGPSVVPVDLR